MNERDQMELLAMVSLRSSADGVALVQWVDDLLDHHVREAEARVLGEVKMAVKLLGPPMELGLRGPSDSWRKGRDDAARVIAARVVRGGGE